MRRAALFLTVALTAACGGQTATPAAAQTAAPSAAKTAAPAAAQTAAPAAPRDVKVVMIQPLTGISATYGKQTADGAEVAVTAINAKGGVLGGKLTLVLEDDASEKTQTATLVRKHGPDSSVLVIIGPVFSSNFVATAPLAEELKIPYVSAGSTAPWPGEFNDWTFRVALPGSAFLPTFTKAVADRARPKTAAQIYSIDSKAQTDQATLLNSLFPQNGITVTASESARDSDNDFRAQITKIMQKTPDVIAIGLSINPAALFIQQARQLGYKGLFMSNGTQLTDPSLFALSRGSADGLLVGASFDATDPSPLVQGFVESFKKRFGAAPTAQNAVGYDAVGVVADAINRANSATDRAKVRDALGNTSNYQGVGGRFSYNRKGDNTTPTVVVLKLTADGFKVW